MGRSIEMNVYTKIVFTPAFIGMFLTSLNVLLCEIFMDLAKPDVKEKFVEGLNTLGKMFK